MAPTLEAATNCWTKAEQAVIDALPNLARFQSFVGESTANAAALRIYVDDLEHPANGEVYDQQDDADLLRAFAIVSSKTETPYHRKRSDTVGRFDSSGQLLIRFQRTTQEIEDKYQDVSDRWFKNRVGDILEALETYFDENGGLYIEESTVVVGPVIPPESEVETLGRYQAAEVAIVWGQIP